MRPFSLPKFACLFFRTILGVGRLFLDPVLVNLVSFSRDLGLDVKSPQ